MDIFYVIMLVLMTGFFCVLSFLVGVLSMLGKTKLNLNPVKAYKEHKEIAEQKKENELKQRQTAVMVENINNYDGTPIGQIDIPNE